MKIKQLDYGTLWNKAAYLYILENDNHMSLHITNYGGIISHWFVPDRDGKPKDIVLGFDNFADYLAGHPFFGAIVGRFANRIDKGRFTLNGVAYQLAAQAAGNHLHGGLRGFDKYIWDSRIEEHSTHLDLLLQHCSIDGDEGYPGTVNVLVCYRLYSDNRFAISYEATTDQQTIINLTNHSYFNLSGNPLQNIDEHFIQINAERYVEVDQYQIPTGNLPLVADSYFDCRKLRQMKDMFAQAPNQVLDHCYVMQNQTGKLCDVAVVKEASTGIQMNLATDNIGVQFYNGNKLGEQKKVGKKGILYPRFAGFCLETQCLPDSPNQEKFPSCRLLPGQTYRHKAEFRFETL